LVALVAVLGAALAEASLPHSSGAAVLFAPDAAVVPAWRRRVPQVLPRPGLAPSTLPVLKAAVPLDQKGMAGRQKPVLQAGGVPILLRE
jgi:hypothetical protein